MKQLYEMINKMAIGVKIGFIVIAVIIMASYPVRAQEKQEKLMEIYGFIMTDAGYNFNQIDPKWFDAVRPSKLPSYKNQFGTDGNFFFSVRQTRLGFRNYFKTSLGELRTRFEFDMFGIGVNAGQTTFRLRHAFAELGKFTVGQTYSPFMDIDIFPNILEYWGPNGMVAFKNIQLRFSPIQGDTRLSFALERPGASEDQGIYKDRIELKEVHFRFPLPDLSAEYRQAFKSGYVEIAGIARSIKWEDQNTDSLNLSGRAIGWGVNLSTNLNLGKKDVFKGQVIYGKGVQNYMNDAPLDIGIKNNFTNHIKPVLGVPLPVLGISAFINHKWNEKLTSAIGYSLVNISNSNAQANDAFRKGQYVVANLLFYPTSNTMVGIEYQWGDRSNFSDGWTSSITKIQCSFKYNFSQSFYKN